MLIFFLIYLDCNVYHISSIKHGFWFMKSSTNNILLFAYYVEQISETSELNIEENIYIWLKLCIQLKVHMNLCKIIIDLCSSSMNPSIIRLIQILFTTEKQYWDWFQCYNLLFEMLLQIYCLDNNTNERQLACVPHGSSAVVFCHAKRWRLHCDLKVEENFTIRASCMLPIIDGHWEFASVILWIKKC